MSTSNIGTPDAFFTDKAFVPLMEIVVVALRAVAPVTVKVVPTVALVVTAKLVPTVTSATVVTAPVKVEVSVTDKVPAVEILVPMVVALAMVATTIMVMKLAISTCRNIFDLTNFFIRLVRFILIKL